MYITDCVILRYLLPRPNVKRIPCYILFWIHTIQYELFIRQNTYPLNASVKMTNTETDKIQRQTKYRDRQNTETDKIQRQTKYRDRQNTETDKIQRQTDRMKYLHT